AGTDDRSNWDSHGSRFEDVPLYVTEEHNHENVKGVAVVEVFLPAPLLARGLCLVDTPGIGSTFAANSEVTRAFVPHIDAALVVLGADPPISGDGSRSCSTSSDKFRTRFSCSTKQTG